MRGACSRAGCSYWEEIACSYGTRTYMKNARALSVAPKTCLRQVLLLFSYECHHLHQRLKLLDTDDAGDNEQEKCEKVARHEVFFPPTKSDVGCCCCFMSLPWRNRSRGVCFCWASSKSRLFFSSHSKSQF